MKAKFGLFVVLATLTTVQSAKFLLVPSMTTSHCLEMMAVGEELLKRGHDVILFPVVLDPKPCLSRWKLDSFKSKFKLIEQRKNKTRFEVDEEIARLNNEAYFKGDRMWTFMSQSKRLFSNLCEAVFDDLGTLETLKREHIDLVLVEALPITGCFFLLPKYLNVPAAGIASSVDNFDSRSPLQTNIFPAPMFAFSNSMSFAQRLVNTLTVFTYPLFKYILLPDLDFSHLSDNLKNLDTRDLIKDAVLFLENSDHVLDYPKASFPNFVEVGGLTAKPAEALPEDLQNIMDSANQGVILVSFGNVLSLIPGRVIDLVMDALGELEQVVLFKQNRSFVKGNIRAMKWIPQNDVLGHRNVKLFISHCGKNGLWESVYHAVPILCTPFHADCFSNAAKVRHRKIGSSINLLTSETKDLVNAVREILGNTTISENVQRISMLIHDRPETPPQRATSALEHVIKYGGDHMRPPSVNHGFVTYIYADVWITLFALLSIPLCLVSYLCKRCCSRKKPRNDKSKRD